MVKRDLVYLTRRNRDLLGAIGKTQILDLNSDESVLTTPLSAAGLCAFRYQVVQVSGTFGSVNLQPVISLDGTNWETVPGQDSFIEAAGIHGPYFLPAVPYVNLKVETARGAASTANVTIFGSDSCEVPEVTTNRGILGQAQIASAATPQTVYQVAAGNYAIVDAVFVVVHGANTNDVEGYITTASTTTAEQFFRKSMGTKTNEVVGTGGAGGLFRMEAGEQIAFESDQSGQITVTVMGVERKI